MKKRWHFIFLLLLSIGLHVLLYSKVQPYLSSSITATQTETIQVVQLITHPPQPSARLAPIVNQVKKSTPRFLKPTSSSLSSSQEKNFSPSASTSSHIESIPQSSDKPITTDTTAQEIPNALDKVALLDSARISSVASQTAAMSNFIQTDNSQTNLQFQPLIPPDSVVLDYTVSARKQNQSENIIVGKAKMDWQVSDHQYAISFQIELPDNGYHQTKISIAKSEGTVTAQGLQPMEFSQKPFYQSWVATHFNRDRNTISFSRVTASFPLQGNEQDRASVIWQIAALGKSAQLLPNSVLSLHVASTVDVMPWDIEVFDEETLALPIGEIPTIPVRRRALAGAYDQHMEVWYSLIIQSWYPVRIRFTENNGDYLDLVLNRIQLPELLQ